MKISKRRKIRPSLVFLLVVALAAAILYPLIRRTLHPEKYIKSPEHILQVTDATLQEGEVVEDQITLTRGTKVVVEERGDHVSKVSWNGSVLSVPNENLADSLEECVDMEYIYPRKLVNLRDSKGGRLTDTVVAKGEALKVVSVDPKDLDPSTGEIAWYEVEKDNETYFVAGTNMETSEAAAMKIYAENLQYTTQYDSLFGEGYAQNAYVEQPDFRGSSQPNWPDNPLRKDIQAIHINMDVLLKNVDYLKELKKTTGINALIVGLKGVGGKLTYESDVPQDFFNDPSRALDQAQISKEELKKVFKDLKNSGFYIIGRMQTFADPALALDHPEWAITDSKGKPVELSEDYWLSAYVRDNWMYNGALAKEFAELGCNEVQFDFVRFPDSGAAQEAAGETNYHNAWKESKVAAVQGFLYYIREELAPLHVYAAADMYGGPVLDNNDYDIGHYYPAIASAANIVSPMVYLDHFNIDLVDKSETDQWERDTLAAFMKAAVKGESSLENPGLLRLYIQGYSITADRVAEEIKGIVDGGGSGYMLWTDTGWKDNLELLKDGFIDSVPDPSETAKKKS